MSKAKRNAKRLLQALKFEPAPLNNKKGRVIDSPESRRLTTKDRRHSGHRIIYCEDEEGNVTQFDEYNDWSNYRDGMRNKWGRKVKRIYPQMFYRDEERYWDLRDEREKIRKKEEIRRMRKQGR